MVRSTSSRVPRIWDGSLPLQIAGKRQNTDQIIDAALKALDLGGTFHFPPSGQAADGGAALRVVCRLRNSRKNSSGGTKKGFSWRTPPMMIIGWVRMMSTTICPPNLARS